MCDSVNDAVRVLLMFKKDADLATVEEIVPPEFEAVRATLLLADVDIDTAE